MPHANAKKASINCSAVGFAVVAIFAVVFCAKSNSPTWINWHSGLATTQARMPIAFTAAIEQLRIKDYTHRSMNRRWWVCVVYFLLGTRRGLRQFFYLSTASSLEVLPKCGPLGSFEVHSSHNVREKNSANFSLESAIFCVNAPTCKTLRCEF